MKIWRRTHAFCVASARLRCALLAPLQRGKEQQPGAEHEETARRQHHDHPGLEVGAEQADAEQRARAEDFAHRAQRQQADGEPDAHAERVDHGGHWRVLRGMRLGTAEDDAVHDDQLDEGAQRVVKRQADRLDDVIDDGDEGGDDDDVGGDAHLFRNQLAQQRHQAAGADQHESGGQAHGQRVDARHRDRQRRAHAQHHDEDRVLAPDTFHEFVPVAGAHLSCRLAHDFSFSLSRLRHDTRQQHLRGIVDGLADGARGDGGAGDGIDFPRLGLAAVLDSDDGVGQCLEIGGYLRFQREIRQEFLVDQDLVADAGRFAHGHHAECRDARRRQIVGEENAHIVGIALGRAFGGDARQPAALVIAGIELQRARRDGPAGADFFHAAGWQSGIFDDRLGGGNDLEHGALDRDALVLLHRIVGALVGRQR